MDCEKKSLTTVIKILQDDKAQNTKKQKASWTHGVLTQDKQRLTTLGTLRSILTLGRLKKRRMCS